MISLMSFPFPCCQISVNYNYFISIFLNICFQLILLVSNFYDHISYFVFMFSAFMLGFLALHLFRSLLFFLVQYPRSACYRV